ncbi:MAG: LytR C-terminal domain-containing protein, partial [Sphingomonas sp.]|nr:LytR C-terminal domain-containing protein [Sphingomonas sp.]
ARHRQQLHGAGWRSVAIGDAPHVRKLSLIVYPRGQRGEARRLASDLRIGTIRPEARTDILVLLGRDRA